MILYVIGIYMAGVITQNTTIIITSGLFAIGVGLWHIGDAMKEKTSREDAKKDK
jgi:hypothetical protein